MRYLVVREARLEEGPQFRSNAEPVIGGTKTSKVVELVWRLESLSDVRELTALLA